MHQFAYIIILSYSLKLKYSRLKDINSHYAQEIYMKIIGKINFRNVIRI